MEKNVERTIGTCRQIGIGFISTCDYSGWNRQEHKDMLILSVNQPEDIRVTYKVNHGVHDWELIRIGEIKTKTTDKTKTKSYTLAIDFDMLKAQKEALLVLNKDNAPDIVLSSIEGILNLLDSIQDQAVDKHGLPEKEVFNLTDTDEDCTDIEHPVTVSPVYDSIAYTQGQLRMFDAYQHFLYYFDQQHFKENSPLGDHMTNHFLDKLAMYRRIHSPEGYNSITVLVTWIQNMTEGYQDAMLGYMLKFHTGKGGGFRSWK